MRRKTTWSKTVEAAGVQVRIFERAPGSIYRDVVLGRTTSIGGKARTRHDVRSLKHGDRKLAVEQAKALAKELATAKLTGATLDNLTLAQLQAVYLRECDALLSRERRREVDKAFGLFRAHVGADFPVADLGPHQVQTYVSRRQTGTLKAKGGGNGGKKVRAGTIAKELGVLHAAFNWASVFRTGGRPLISHNPLRGIPLPAEPNPARPVATRERFEKLLEQADGLDRRGAFRVMLHLAWFTGRRLGSIVALRVADVLLTQKQVQGALAAAGAEEYLTEEWAAAIRWDAEADKEGVEWIVPIPEGLRATLADYIRTRALVGNALLFSARRNPSEPLSKETAYYWIRQAEDRAKLQHQTRGGWHAFRRGWATARKHMPLQDVMAAGGWRDPSALQRAYQHADGRTVLAVMELEA